MILQKQPKIQLTLEELKTAVEEYCTKKGENVKIVGKSVDIEISYIENFIRFQVEVL